ncbi:MAG: hypothetical protein U0797_02475 [Gemmataceae bacterium]
MSDPKTPSRWRPGVADLLFLLVALAGMRGARHTLLDDPGLGWHIRNIDAILDRGGWLTEDPFTDPRGEAPPRWYTNQWLGEAPYWLGWKWAGLEGIAAVNAVVIATIAGALYRVLLADGLAWPVAMVWAALGMMGTSCSWNARPNVFTVLFVLLTARACVRLHEGKLTLAAGAGVVLMFAAWANTHGGFVAGLILLAVTGCIEFACAVFQTDEDARSRLVPIGFLSICAGLATLANPYGIDLYRWVLQLLGDKFFMDLHQEWRSPDFNSAGAMRYELLILLFPLVLGLSARRPNIVELALSVLWLHFALTGFRYVALWVVVAVPLMGRSSVEIPFLQELARRLQLGAAPDSLFHTPTTRPAWLWSILLGAGLLLGAKPLQGRFAVHKQEIIANEALDQLLARVRAWREKNGRRPVVIHDYNWGGYVTWHGWPEVLNWIDDRNEVQGQRRIQDYFDLMKAKPGWERQLIGADFVCIDPEAELTRRLSEDDRWTRGEAPNAAIFERKPTR